MSSGKKRCNEDWYEEDDEQYVGETFSYPEWRNGPLGKHHVYVALEIMGAPNCHVTVCIHKQATPEIVKAITDKVEELQPKRPIRMELGNLKNYGAFDAVVPGYRVYMDTGFIFRAFHNLYKHYYCAGPNEPWFPTWRPHITIDTTQKRAAIESFFPKGILYADRLIVESHVREDRVAVVAEYLAPPPSYSPSAPAPATSPDWVQLTPGLFVAPPVVNPEPSASVQFWKCINCGTENSVRQKECAGRGCSQWRPASAIPAKPGDWKCPGCGGVVFARKIQCGKCFSYKPK